MSGWARIVGEALLRSTTINSVAREFARVRGHRLILVYHRLCEVPPEYEVVPTIPVDLFRAHIQALGDLCDLVTLDEILVEKRSSREAVARKRAAVAVTFDDDLPSHATHALPVLREFSVPATFFLSGRALHGLGTYWFQELEALLVTHGERRAAALLHLPEHGAGELALACERNTDLRRRVSEAAAGLATPGILQRDEIATLAAGGMTIGFHTVKHDVLPELTGAVLDDAVSRGREDLSAAAGTAVRYFAYPHGKADTHSAAAVRRAGFDAAFTGIPQPVRRGDDRYRLGRWEPGAIGVDDLLVNIAIRMNRVGVRSIEGAGDR